MNHDADSRGQKPPQGHETPVCKGITPTRTETSADSPYCTGCGHDLSRHRGGRCWTGAEGEPLHRTRSLIACLCDGIESSDIDAAISRHPAGKHR